MFRRVVAIIMVLMMAAGQSLCCCSFTHLFARQADDRTTPAAEPCCCCPASKREQETPTDKSEHKKPGCPCRDDLSKPAVVERAVELPDQLRVMSFLPVLSFEFDSPNRIGVSGSPGGPLPHLSAHDILHVHHQLRC